MEVTVKFNNDINKITLEDLKREFCSKCDHKGHTNKFGMPCNPLQCAGPFIENDPKMDWIKSKELKEIQRAVNTERHRIERASWTMIHSARFTLK